MENPAWGIFREERYRHKWVCHLPPHYVCLSFQWVVDLQSDVEHNNKEDPSLSACKAASGLTPFTLAPTLAETIFFPLRTTNNKKKYQRQQKKLTKTPKQGRSDEKKYLQTQCTLKLNALNSPLSAGSHQYSWKCILLCQWMLGRTCREQRQRWLHWTTLTISFAGPSPSHLAAALAGHHVPNHCFHTELQLVKTGFSNTTSS